MLVLCFVGGECFNDKSLFQYGKYVDARITANSAITDVEECLSEPSICGPNSTCINTVGGYSCSCWSGFNITNSSLSISVNNSCSGKLVLCC